ncbi:related to SWC4 SWr Complex member [Phialocephala subalpina]|uniref:SWR1-complex protein 4 n=1 Tax=Phialocephala subalpina TaxID=576137 RepID=A0A1L7X5U2_9HELO|nr:related to SWC4 SWr Complex member [Phialocephala subalpina]
MTSHDVRDMLDLPGEAAPRPAKKQKVAAPRPVLKGLAREVQNLGGDNPIAIVPEVSVFKKKRFGSRKPAAKWENRSFKNSARDDETLVLKHWRRKDESSAAPSGEGEAVAQDGGVVEDSTFAKYNVKVITPQYDDEQYQRHLQDNNWSKDETDYLVSLARDYDLRWPIIWDRYEYQPAINLDPETAEVAIVAKAENRTLENLKARYYTVAATMMKVHKPPESMNQAEFNLLELMQNFNPNQEKSRKQFAEAAFSRTKEEAREEESLLIELKRILARSDKLAEERRELYARLEAPPSTGNIGVFTSSQGLQQLLHQLMQADKSKKRRSIMGPDGTSPAGPSGLNQQPSFDRRESSVRESTSGPSGGSNNKKGPAQPGPTERRQLAPEEMQLYGVKIPERIPSSGPSFRSEKLQKPITSKSSVQQQKMLSVLTELGIPHRLIMPTIAVGESYEALLGGIATLIDQRKVMEKIQGEINTIKEKKRREEEERAAKMSGFGGDGVGDDRDVKVEEGEREKSAAPSMSDTGGQHKRSASVLSAVSEKSTKRQKK